MPSSRPPARNDDRQRAKPPTAVILYGRHAVVAALANPKRRAKMLWLDQTQRAELTAQFEPLLRRHPIPPVVQWTSRAYIAKTAQGDAPQGVPHQGVMLRASPLAGIDEAALAALPPASLIVALDQVTDPHNIGAIVRSGVAFGASALLTTDRHTPYESGLLAKTASGGLERLDWCRTRNLADTLAALQACGFCVIGLDGNRQGTLGQLPDLAGQRLVLVLGAEGKGLRARTATLLDHAVRLPTRPDFPHLNVSNAAAIALYTLRERLG